MTDDQPDDQPDTTGCCGSTYPGRIHFKGCANGNGTETLTYYPLAYND